MLKSRGDSIKGKKALVSGSGNVAQYTVEKVSQLGGKTISLSDSDGSIIDLDGIDKRKQGFEGIGLFLCKCLILRVFEGRKMVGVIGLEPTTFTMST